MESTLKRVREVKRISVASGGAFKYFLPISEGSQVLVADTLTGGTSLSLSPHFSIVVCLCSEIEDALAVKERFKDERNSNIKIVIGTIDSLPFKKESFQTLCLHNYDFNQIQRNNKFLLNCSSICSCLDSSGILYLSYRLPDKSKSKIIKNFRINNKIFNFINKNGFQNICSIEHYESFSKLHFLKVSMNQRNGIIDSIRNFKKKFISENFGYVFQKVSQSKMQKSCNTYINNINEFVEGNFNLKLQNAELIRLGSTGSIVVDCGNYIMRMPQTKQANRFCEANFNTITKLHEFNFSSRIPKPEIKSSLLGQEFYVETKIPGISLDLCKLPASKSLHIVDQAYSFLVNKVMIQGKIDNHNFEALINKPLRKMKTLLHHEHLSIFQEISELIILHLTKFDALPLVISHGDFKFSNFLCTHNREIELVGIIDWEYSKMKGLPIYDLMMMLAWNVSPWMESSQTIPNRFWNIACSKNIRSHLISYMEKLNIDSSLLKPLAIIFIIKYLQKYFLPEVMKSGVWYNEMIDNCLIPACTTLISELST